MKKGVEEKERAQEDAAVDISLSTVMTLSRPSKTGVASEAQPSSAAKRQGRVVTDEDSDSDANSELLNVIGFDPDLQRWI